jgi:hypothetical protein
VEPLQPVFDEAACALSGVSPEIRPRLRCGTVSVPRNYDDSGAGDSSWRCPDLDRAFLDAAVAVATDPSEDVLAKPRTVYAACRAEALAHGFDLKDFGTSITVADFEWVRRALGIERWNGPRVL